MVTSIRADEARHAQIGHPVLALVMKHDPDYAQYLIDKEFWRNWHLFSILTGVSMDYLTAADQRSGSFKEFMEEWIVDQFFHTLDEFGLKKPCYWDMFLDELEIYHHMIYASAYTYRQYTGNVPSTGMTWTQCGNASESDGRMSVGADKESSALGTVLPAFCDLCQLPLAPELPTIIRPTSYRTGAKTMFSALNHVAGSLPQAQEIRESRGPGKRVLTGEAPADFMALLTDYFRLTPDKLGKDVYAGDYEWLKKAQSAP
jgi:toluene monooxygenase system protein A